MSQRALYLTLSWMKICRSGPNSIVWWQQSRSNWLESAMVDSSMTNDNGKLDDIDIELRDSRFDSSRSWRRSDHITFLSGVRALVL